MSSPQKTFLTLFLFVALTGFAQVPQTDLYVFQLTQDDTLRWHIHSPRFVSSWNPKGYTNQPEWISNDRLLVSGRNADSDQNEIYLLDLSSRLIKRCTDTPENEYSPRIMADGQAFSVVRQAQGDVMDQQLYAFPLDLSDQGRALYPTILNVGYYCWLEHAKVALFLVDDPPKLAFLSGSDKSPRIYSSLIGRSLNRTPSGMLAYVHKYSDTFWYLKNLDTDSKRSEILIETLPSQEDFAIGPSGCYFMGAGSILYVYDPSVSPARWVPVFDLSIFGIREITRLSINANNQIAVVDQRE